MKVIMDLIQNIETIISLICGVGSIVMFWLSKKNKDECQRINNLIDQKIEIINKNSNIASNDQFNIENVKKFDNRKSIK